MWPWRRASEPAPGATAGVAADPVSASGGDGVARPGDVTLHIGGMTCAGCATTIRDGLLQLPGVESAGVSPVTRKAILRPDGTAAGDEVAMLAEAAIAGLGYRVIGEPGHST